ncbi:aspartate kinase [Tumebacillus sp. ITR2]|uniref:Aspartokinase n=1 Tax=Tumebacillus amylolyticus TaxID=2801339 RepID=A0ABS1JA69_9BACL|nr:aspartate kinase [Tumebacillus amylolyticus]MBL0387175.1 aspartate kinase [Tumebacillus amylolyticus]
MTIYVQKFGGTSVADAERIQKAARRLVETAQAGHQVVAVVSAMGHTTDHLVDLAGLLSDNPSPREIDMLLSTGEQVTCALMAIAVQQLGASSISLTGGLAGIRTESHHGRARIIDIDPTRIWAELGQGKIVIVAGFQGLTPCGEIATLGRGGSDTTAVALAGALGADLCEIYTDVDGVYTTDPRIVPHAQRINEIPYDEMWELAHLGANVLHPRAVEAARRHRVPVRVRSSFEYDDPGTLLTSTVANALALPVYGIALDPDLQSGWPGDTFEADGDLAKISVVAAPLTTGAELHPQIRVALEGADISVHGLHVSVTCCSCLVEKSHVHEAVRVLHTALGLDAKRTKILDTFE